MKRHNSFKLRKNNLSTVLFGILCAIISFILSAFIASLILISGNDPISRVGIASMCAFLISGAVTGIAVTKYRGDGKMRASLITSSIIVFIVIIISLIGTKGQVSGGVFINCACYILISALASILGNKQGKRRHKRR